MISLQTSLLAVVTVTLLDTIGHLVIYYDLELQIAILT